MSIGCFVSNVVGGICEPTLFGVILNDRKNTVYMIISSFLCALYCGIMNVQFYFFGASNILMLLSFINADRPMNIVHAIIASVIGLVSGFLLEFILGPTPKEEKLSV